MVAGITRQEASEEIRTADGIAGRRIPCRGIRECLSHSTARGYGSGDGANARAVLVNTKGWTILDGGEA